MNEKPFCIFVVDDDPLLRLIITDQLQNHGYQIHEFENGEDCIAALDLQPNLILLDIEMPGKSGLDICREIREMDFDNIQVMFISAHDDIETLMEAFNAGGNDFIPKNSKKEVLLRKVQIAIEAEQQKQELQNQLSFARNTAFTAMSSLGETGIVLQFLQSSFHCLDLKQLGNLLIETISNFGLNALLKLTDSSGELCFSSELVCSPLETSILHYVAKLGRISQTGDRLVLNFPNVTILIIGLNTDEEEIVGRLRDHLAIIAEGAGVRIDAMNTEQKRIQQANARIDSIKELANLFNEIESTQHANQIQMENLNDQLRQEMELAFVHLGLTEDQELLLHNIVNNITDKLNQLFDSNYDLALRLNHIVAKQKTLLAESLI